MPITEIKPKIKLELLDVELNLPDYTQDLQNANDASLALQQKFLEIKSKKQMNDYWHDKLYEDNSRILVYVGQLSRSVFNVENKLEQIYTRTYIDHPIEVKRCWYAHYDKLHQPFTVIKNRCWRMYDELDIEYRRINGKNSNPPNYDKRLYENINTHVDDLPKIDTGIEPLDDIFSQGMPVDNLTTMYSCSTLNEFNSIGVNLDLAFDDQTEY